MELRMKLYFLLIIVIGFEQYSCSKIWKYSYEWSEEVIKSAENLISFNFKHTYCLQVLNDKRMEKLLLKTIIPELPVFYVGVTETKCRKFLLAFEDIQQLQAIFRNGSLPREAKYLVFSSNENSEHLLRETIKTEFYLDVLLSTVSNISITSPVQLGIVVGNNGRVDLQGRKLSIVGVVNPPFAVFEPKKKIKLNGVEVRVVRELAETLNFTWNVHLPKDKQGRGQRNFTGHWTGLRGELTYGHADIGLATLYLSLEHYLSFQLSYQYTQFCLTFLVPAPKSLVSSGHWGALLRPLKLSSWLTFLLISAIHVIMLYIITKDPVNKCILETIRGAALVSSPQPSGPISQRLLFATWILGSFLVANLYNSELSAWMVAHVSETPLRSLQDLAKSKIMWGKTDTEMVFLLQQSPSVISRDLIAKFILESSEDDMERKVLRGNYAVFVHVLSDGYPSGAEFLSANARRKLVPLQECAISQYVSIGMRRGLPLIQATSLELTRLQEGGLLQEWQARDVKTYGDLSDYKNLNPSKAIELSPLDLNNLAGVFAFWILGHLLALITFIIENIYPRFKIIYVKNNLK